MIADALDDTANIVVPATPFTKGESGSLLLIADHMPFVGAAEALARAFGVCFMNGYARSTIRGAPSVMFRLYAATLKVGRGRVAFFGEAAMFSAQLVGPEGLPMGMNVPEVAQNATFVLNVMHWLSGMLAPAERC